MTFNNSQELSFISKTELEWLLGKKQLSKSFEYKIKSTIKKKIDIFLSFELPLLIHNEILDKQLIQDIIDNPNNMLPILGKEEIAKPKVWNHTGIPAQGCVYRNNEHELHNIDTNFNHNSQCETLPNMGKTLTKFSKIFLTHKALSTKVKREILKNQNYKCAICKRNNGVWDYDHKNGDKSNNKLANCQALCPNCHAKKTRGLLKSKVKSSRKLLKLFIISLIIIVVIFFFY